ncbi:YrhB family protein [Actinacidiphila glaucinigra]|uniref:YrhB domain-containing protein n=1 Tax=Actinacidiphila glaucinigra TaxID=235986 RepID=UPI002DD800D0|nr:YrhB domain-containing protein [Actinacidiphila glaucinigra]WSD57654.1 YrhB family protein [Actinacidiphila glaucinigra]
MIERGAAVRIVEGELEREDQKWAATDPHAVRTAVSGVDEHELVWIVYWQAAKYVRTGNRRYALIGNGPYLVDRVDGSLHRIGVVSSAGGHWEADYRARIRGLPVRTAVDDLHDEVREVAATRGRIHAVRTLRQRLPVLSPAQAHAYMSGLQQGSAPAGLIAIATTALVEPINPVFAVETIRQGISPQGNRLPDEP